MRSLKKLFAIASCFVIARFLCLHATDGFADWKIQSQLPYSSKWNTDSISIQSIIDQPFTYLGHGAQCYAFVSHDEQYVLKFYQHHKASHPLAFLNPLLCKIGYNRLSQTLKKRKEKREKDFISYMHAHDLLPKETGLIYLHLNPTKHIQKKVKLYDKIGALHYIDLDKTVFILQKKAVPVYTALEEWISKGQFEQAEQNLTALVFLLAVRAKKGLYDKDADLSTNFGFTKEGPIQFDIGRYKIDPSRKEKKIYKEELLRVTDKLCEWLQQKSPELAEHVKREIQKV